MPIFQAIVLGLVQGFAEFFPISSSGHLILIPRIFGWAPHGLVFDTTLHLATAATLVFFFRNDIFDIVFSIFKDIKAFGLSFEQYSRNSLLGFMIALGCLPAALIGFFLDDYFETVFRDVRFATLFVFLGCLLLIFAEFKKNKSGSKLNFKNSFIVGLFQSLALFPGMSRSGSTISGGMLIGLSREDAAKFSFLLSIPIVVMAGVFKLHSTNWTEAGITLPVILSGFISAFISGLIALNYLMKFLKNGTLKPFIIYRLILVGLMLFILL